MKKFGEFFSAVFRDFEENLCNKSYQCRGRIFRKRNSYKSTVSTSVLDSVVFMAIFPVGVDLGKM